MAIEEGRVLRCPRALQHKAGVVCSLCLDKGYIKVSVPTDEEVEREESGEDPKYFSSRVTEIEDAGIVLGRTGSSHRPYLEMTR